VRSPRRTVAPGPPSGYVEAMRSPYLSPRTEPLARYALGCMNFGWRTPKADALRILARAMDEGVGLLDTANIYADGESERIVGEAARGRDVLVASKVGYARVGGRLEGLGREAVMSACDASLSRLKRDRIDLYYLHVPDGETALEETLGALHDLLSVGKIGAWGVSNHAAWQILELSQLARSFELPPPAAAQQLYNVLVRQLDIEYFAYTRRHPLHTTVYNALAGGLLTGVYRFEDDAPKGTRFDKSPIYRRRYWQRALFEAVEQLKEVAAAEGVSLARLAYAFLLRRPGVDSVVLGPRNEAHLEDALAARGHVLSPDALAKIDAVHVGLVGTDVHYAR
jgi:aryl-alcohol dehydrogenase-like predicted oxidoreductase